MAMAIACFWGRPSFLSVLMLELMAFLEDPFFRGMAHHHGSVERVDGVDQWDQDPGGESEGDEVDSG